MLSFLFRRPDYGFAGYEKQLERISTESAGLLAKRGKRRQISTAWSNRFLTASLLTSLPCLAWVSYLRNHGGNQGYTTLGYITQTSTPFAFPLLLCIISGLIQRLSSLGERREDRRLKRLEEQKKKLIKELKDSTRFDKIASLLSRYDPPANVAPAQAMRSHAHNQGVRVGGVLDSALESAGKFAQSIMGDNPTLLAELQRASLAAAQLKAENQQLHQQLEALRAKYEPQEARTERASSHESAGISPQEAMEGGDASTIVAISKSSSFTSIKSQKEEECDSKQQQQLDADSKGLRQRTSKAKK